VIPEPAPADVIVGKRAHVLTQRPGEQLHGLGSRLCGMLPINMISSAIFARLLMSCPPTNPASNIAHMCGNNCGRNSYRMLRVALTFDGSFGITYLQTDDGDGVPRNRP
jgi:hypothetical protein